MTITLGAGAMSIKEIEHLLPFEGVEHYILLTQGLDRERQDEVEPSGGEFEVRWLTNWSDWSVMVPFARTFTSRYPARIRLVELREAEGIGRSRYVAGDRNHLMPGGVNPKIPAIREVVLEDGEQASRRDWEANWSVRGTSELVNALRTIKSRFELINELAAAVTLFDHGFGVEADRGALAVGLGDAARALILAISESASVDDGRASRLNENSPSAWERP